MTTLKPQLVRADTLDLQDHNAPSAKDHTRQPTHPAPYGSGPAAPHQNQALRNAEHEAYEEQKYTPRVGDDHGRAPFPDESNFYDNSEDGSEHERPLHIGAPGEEDGAGSGYEDGEQMDDDLDDDMMDKISSSPSIDDGKYTLPIWPPRSDSVDSGVTRSPESPPTRGTGSSSSPFTSTPEHFPFSFCEPEAYLASHHLGEYKQTRPGPRDSPFANDRTERDAPKPQADNPDIYGPDEEAPNVNNYLLPIDDSHLEKYQDTSFDEGYGDQECDWEDEDEIAISDDDPSSDDDTSTFQFTDDPRFIDSGWGGECLRELEDIDFEFVYALHTFVATVEGQANATKGDTMVLLDDSNSYWWLVRVVKDGSIGYLPAEHIETPTERLARLNKHRNIDLSATMLGDAAEKSRNPLKKAMRRRNAKTVQFSAPTYYEPSDYEYSDEEEQEDSQLLPTENDTRLDEEEQTPEDQDRTATIDPAPLSTNNQSYGGMVNGIKRVTSDESLRSDKQSSPVMTNQSQMIVAVDQGEDLLHRSRKGNVRNTDSFFKDDTVETKKISLTPRLLRGDSEVNAVTEEEARQRPSLETFDRLLSPDEKPKDDKRKKEKKGMLSGLFKRKDKGTKGPKAEGEETEKSFEDAARFSAPSKDSTESLGKVEASPERKPSKLQKQPPLLSTRVSPIENRPVSKDSTSTSPTDGPFIPAPIGPAPPPPTLRPLQTEQPPAQRLVSSGAHRSPVSPAEKKSIFSPITTVLKSSSSNSSFDHEPIVTKIYSKRAKERFAIDESDSGDESTPTTEHHNDRSTSPIVGPEGAVPQRHYSPVQESPFEAPGNRRYPERPPALVVDTITGMGHATRPDSQDSSASAVHVGDSDAGTNTAKTSPSTNAPTPSTSRSTPTWSDASLRSYMDNDQGMKDLLIIIHDSSNVAPAGPDHPLVGNLFVNEKTRLAEMQSNLDSLLTNWISKKNANLLSR